MTNNFYQKVKDFFKAKSLAEKNITRTKKLSIDRFQFAKELKKIPARTFKLSSTGKNLLLDLELKLQDSLNK
jgi:hypothetical protein